MIHVIGHGYEGKYVVVETCDANDSTQRGWSYDASTSTVKGPGGLCLDNRTQTFKGSAVPQPENGQFQLRPCDDSEFQKFVLNTTAVPPPLASLSSLSWPSGARAAAPGDGGGGTLSGVLQSNDVPIGNSSRVMPGACSAGVG